MNKLIDTEGLLTFKTDVVDPAIAAAVSSTEAYVNGRIPELPTLDTSVAGSFSYVLKAVVDSEQHVNFSWELLPSDSTEE